MLQNVSPIPSPIKMSCYLHFIHHTDIIGYIPTLYCTHQENHPSSQSSEGSKQPKILQNVLETIQRIQSTWSLTSKTKIFAGSGT